MTRKSPTSLALVLALAVGLCACGGGGSPKAGTTATTAAGQAARTTAPKAMFTAGDLGRLMVQTSDLPAGYQRKDKESGPRSAQDCTKATTREEAALAAQLQSLGIQACYSATFHKEVKTSTGNDSNDPGSSAFLFGDAIEASKALPVLREAYRASQRSTGTGGATVAAPTDVAVSGLGDESTPGLRFPFGDYFLLSYWWRVRNVVMFFGAGNTLGDMNDQTIVDIAKKLDFRAAT